MSSVDKLPDFLRHDYFTSEWTPQEIALKRNFDIQRLRKDAKVLAYYDVIYEKVMILED